LIIHETLLHRFLIARTASSSSFNLFQQAFASGDDEHKSVAFPTWPPGRLFSVVGRRWRLANPSSGGL